MIPPTKDQADIGIEDVVHDCSEGDMARQEFKNDADINYMLSKFGVAPTRGAPAYGEWDDTIDLQMALESTRDARTAFKKLDPKLQARFGSMDELLLAVETGSLQIKEEPAPSEPAATPPAP